MSRVWGYARGSTLPDFASVEEQRTRIQEYVTTHLAGHEFMGCTVDDLIAARKLTFLERPCALAMNNRMDRGDHVVVARMDRGWRKMADFIHCVTLWQARGITTHVLDFALTVNVHDGLQTLRAVAEWERLVYTEQYKEATWFQRRLVEPHVSNPGPGWSYKVAGWTKEGDAKKKLVPDERERKIMREIVDLVDNQNYSWVDVKRLLDARKEKWCRRSGTRRYLWTDIRIRKAYKVMKGWMADGGEPKTYSRKANAPPLSSLQDPAAPRS